jgi:hypothetical protein
MMSDLRRNPTIHTAFRTIEKVERNCYESAECTGELDIVVRELNGSKDSGCQRGLRRTL